MIDIDVYNYITIYVHVQRNVSIFVCMHFKVNLIVPSSGYKYKIYIYVCMYICIYLFMYVYTYIYIHIYIKGQNDRLSFGANSSLYGLFGCDPSVDKPKQLRGGSYIYIYIYTYTYISFMCLYI